MSNADPILSALIFIVAFLAVAIHFIKEGKKEEQQRFMNNPEIRYDKKFRSANMTVPFEFRNNGPIEINVRSSSKGPFILIIDGKEAGTIEKQLKFIETLPGMRDITILTKRRRKIYHTIRQVQQFTNITVYGFLIHHVRIRN